MSNLKLAAFVSEGLVQELSVLFPDKLPRHLGSPEEMGKLIGQQMVIDKLKAALKDAQANILEIPTIKTS